MDLTNITTVTKSSTKRQNFDLRYSKSNSQFQVSDSFFNAKNMNNNGFKFHLAEGGKTPLLSIWSNEEAVFFKGKESSDEKNPTFYYNIMEDTLKELGLLTEDKHTRFTLEEVGEKDDVTYFKVSPVSDEEDVAETDASEQAEIVDSEEAEEEVEETSDDLVEEDPFA